ncbi:hypothetical protein [Kitasatospora sp. NPDC093102]|uniref:hypothetical protein n=1 Tax=Kitasatospora sp. NPDC093102 TaxID=3155069 RepID=UPI00343CFC13
MEYRRNAMARLEQAEELDLPIRLAATGGRAAGVLLAVLVTAGTLWAFTGSLPRTMTATGVIAPPPASRAAGEPVVVLYVARQDADRVTAGSAVSLAVPGVPPTAPAGHLRGTVSYTATTAAVRAAVTAQLPKDASRVPPGAALVVVRIPAGQVSLSKALPLSASVHLAPVRPVDLVSGS